MPTNSAGRNFKRTRESSLFGTRKLAFYALTCSTDKNLVGDFTTGYSFRVNTVTGAVTFDADITALGTDHMLDLGISEIDDNDVEVTLPFDIEFLGGGTTNTIWINSNSGISFYDHDSNRPDPASPGTGIKEIFIANNDGDIQFLYTDDPEDGTFRVKFRGNTDYNIEDVVNLTWEALFREGETYIDFFVSQQPTDWAAYDDGQGNVTWGVTNGTNWVDGRTVSQRGESFVPFVNNADELWRLPNSTYYQVVQAIQQSGAEIFWLGTPHNRTEPFQVDWSSLTLDDTADGFMFAIVDDADAPTAFLDSTTSGTVISTATVVEQNVIEFDGGVSNVYIGQRVTFDGEIGGLVAGQDYYVKTMGDYDGGKRWITVSDTVEREVLDIVYPVGPGGEPGPELTIPADTGSVTATFYNYTIEWGGTAGDVLSSCCYNLTQPGVSPQRINSFIGDSGAMDGPGYWWMERCNPSFSIFPAWQLQTP